MSAYTKRNLKAGVEDMAPKFDLSPDMEYRPAREPLEGEHSAISYLRLAPGFRMPFGHTHEQQEEIYLVVSGSVRMKLDDEIVELQAWDAIRVAPEVARAPEAGPNGAEIVAFGAPQVAQDSRMLPEFWPT